MIKVYLGNDESKKYIGESNTDSGAFRIIEDYVKNVIGWQYEIQCGSCACPKRKSPACARTSNVIFTFNIITYLEVVSGG